MAGLRVHFVFPAELVGRVDAALTDGQSRGEFVRAAVEQALGGVASGYSSSVASPRGTGGFKEDRATPSSTPAEQPSDYVCPQCGPAPEGPDEHAVRAHTWPAEPPVMSETEAEDRDWWLGRSRSSVQAKRDVRPVPKKGEK